MNETVKVKGMSCQHCVMRVTEALKGLKGVDEVRVDLATGTVTVSGAGEGPGRVEIVAAIAKAGYTPEN